MRARSAVIRGIPARSLWRAFPKPLTAPPSGRGSRPMDSPTKFVPIQDLLAGAWPHWLGTAPDIGSVLNVFGAAGASISRDATTGLPNGATFQLAVLDQVTLDLPILPGFQLQTGVAGGTVTPFTATVQTTPHLTVLIANLPITLY